MLLGLRPWTPGGGGGGVIAPPDPQAVRPSTPGTMQSRFFQHFTERSPLKNIQICTLSSFTAIVYEVVFFLGPFSQQFVIHSLFNPILGGGGVSAVFLECENCLHGVHNFYLPTFPENVSTHYVQVGVIRLLSGGGINRKTKHHP